MSHLSRLHQTVIDVPADGYDEELTFWQAATGETASQLRYPEYHGMLLRSGDFALLTQRLDDGPARVHLDIHTDDLEAEVARLERLGATRVRQVHTWWVMRDPAGLPFCVIPNTSGSLTDDNATRWD